MSKAMLKLFTACVLLTGLSACMDNGGSSWDRQSWVDPTIKPNYVALKALEQPGMY